MEKSQIKKTVKLKNYYNNIMNLVSIKIKTYKTKQIIKRKKIEERSDNQEFVNLIEKARLDLEQSKKYFANVTDPDLVDYAAHKILANQYFYTYLLKKAKSENITSDL